MSNIIRRVSEMDNTKVSVEVEAGSWLTETGIETTVYIGDVDMPQVVKTESLESLIAKTLLSYGFGDTIASIHKEEVEQLLAMLKNAHEYAEERVREMGFDE
jgi:N-acetylglucosamine-6-phosphate deacetylase